MKLQQVELERDDHVRSTAWVSIDIHPKKGKHYYDKRGHIWLILDVYDQVVDSKHLNPPDRDRRKEFPSLR